jgi:hypothetical protein
MAALSDIFYSINNIMSVLPRQLIGYILIAFSAGLMFYAYTQYYSCSVVLYHCKNTKKIPYLCGDTKTTKLLSLKEILKKHFPSLKNT